MWHSVIPVGPGYDPVICEGDLPTTVVVINSGPDTVEARAWKEVGGPGSGPDYKLELRAGSQRILRAALIRVGLKGSGGFAAVGARVITNQP